VCFPPGMTAEEEEPATAEGEEPAAAQARTVTLIKHRVATHETLSEDAFRSCELQSALAVDLLAARDVHGTQRFRCGRRSVNEISSD
jgi:hypothetical protein